MTQFEEYHVLGATHGRYGLAQNQCYWNALKSALVIQEMYPQKSVSYVQGFALHPMSVDDKGVPKLHPHGWLKVDGVIFEPTPAWHNKMYMTMYSPVLTVNNLPVLYDNGDLVHQYVYNLDTEAFDQRLELFQSAGFDTSMCEY